MIEPSTSFKDNLAQLPPPDELARIDLLDATGKIVGIIENAPGKQGSLVVYRYLHEQFGQLGPASARHGLVVFAEHTADARQHPGAHPNIDRLLTIAEGGEPLEIRLVPAA